MAPTPWTEDFYAVLEIEQIADSAAVTSSYRRLAKLRHPDKARDQSRATAEFQLLSEAYSTLKDPELRRKYDKEYFAIRSAQGQSTSQSQETEKGATATPRHSPNAANETTGVRLTRLQKLKANLEAKRNTVTRERETLRKLQSEIDALHQQEGEEQRTEPRWGSYLTSFLFQSRVKSEEEKTRRERAHLDRIAAVRIKTLHVQKQQMVLDRVEAELRIFSENVLAEERAYWQAWGEQREAEAMEDERKAAHERQKRRQEEAMAESKKRDRERAAVAEMEREHLRKECAAAATAAAIAESERLAREARKRHVHRNTHHSGRRSRSEPFASCAHREWWNRVEGRQQCSRCYEWTRKFAFKCPQCQTVACALCRTQLKAENRP